MAVDRIVHAHSGQRYWTIATDAPTSRRMARVRQRSTKPELIVRSTLWKAGYRYTINNSDLAGSPDLANRSKRWAVFVHGCYWHRHPKCPRASTPKRNREYWREKFRTHVQRDRRAQTALKDQGFEVVVIWACQTKNTACILRRVEPVLQPSLEMKAS